MQPIPAPTGCAVRLIEFDFASKIDRTVGLERLGPAAADGHHLWIDLDISDDGQAREFLAGLELIDRHLLEDATKPDPATHLTRFDDYLYIALTGCRVLTGTLTFERISVFVAQHFLLTIHHGPVGFLEDMEREYHADFVRFAKGPGSLLYELLEHLTENFISGQRYLAGRVEALQGELVGEIDESLFLRAAQLSNDVLTFRKALVPARSVLTELGMRKSPFVSDETRPFLVSMEATVERVLTDVLSDRELLSGSLDLYMSMVGHRTNETMKRLTAVSIIFLPLTFLCGVYGMNFRGIPEIEWEHGYAFFWLFSAVLVAGLAWMMRRARML
jgi:magnesium transporter